MTRFVRGVGSLLVLAVVATSSPSAIAGSERVDRGARPRTELPDGRIRSEGPGAPMRAPAFVSSEVAAPVNEGGFNAISGNPGISPSDTTGAGGPNHVVTAVNVNYAVWPRDQLTSPAPASPPPLASGTLKSLFPNLPGFVFDPRVVYDQFRGRYVLVFLMGQGGPFTGGKPKSRILIVTIPEASAHDPATWCKRKINGDQIKKDGKQFADYPGLGFDRKFLYIGTNQFAFGPQEAFEYSQITAIGKSRLYNCRGKIKVESFGRKQTKSGGPAFTIMPSITQGGAGKTQFLASFNDRSCGPFCGNRMTIWRIKRQGKQGLTLRKDVVGVPTGRLAPLGTQLGGSETCSPIHTCWDAGDLRLVYAFYDGDRDRLYTAHTVEADIGFGDGYVEAAVRWYEFDPTPIKRARLLRTGILGASQRDAGWASMATDAAGNLHLTYSQAGAPPPGEYLSAYAATVPPGATVPDATTVLTAGESTYVQGTGRPQRWGDFTAANRDPVDPMRVWLINQYARTDGTPPTTPLWQQTVHRVSFG